MSLESQTSQPTPTGRNRGGIWGAAIAILSLGMLPVIEFTQRGRSAAERLATEMVLPVGFLWCGLTVFAAGLIGRRIAGCSSERRLGYGLTWFVLLLWLGVGLVGNRYVAWLAMTATEYQAEPLAAEQRFSAVVMLGGGLNLDPLNRPQLGSDGDRIRPLLQLYQAGQTERLIVTGTAVDADDADQRSPAEVAEQLLVSMGVPRRAIIKIPGVNTAAEMRGLKELLAGGTDGLAWAEQKELDDDQPIGLVTSAFHLPRALRLAEQEGLKLYPIPTAFRASSEPLGFAQFFVPNVAALDDFSRCWREWLAGLLKR